LRLFDNGDLKVLSKYVRSMPLINLNPKQSFVFSYIEYRYPKSQVDIAQLRAGECQAAAILALLLGAEDIELLKKQNILGFILVFAKSLVERADFTKGTLKNQIVLRDISDQIWAKSLIALNSEFDSNEELRVVTMETGDLFTAINSVTDIVALHTTWIGVKLVINQLDSIIQRAIIMLDGKGTNKDKRHIEYRRDLVQFLRTQPSENSFVFDKTKTPSMENKAPKREVLSLSKARIVKT